MEKTKAIFRNIHQYIIFSQILILPTQAFHIKQEQITLLLGSHLQIAHGLCSRLSIRHKPHLSLELLDGIYKQRIYLCRCPLYYRVIALVLQLCSQCYNGTISVTYGKTLQVSNSKRSIGSGILEQLFVFLRHSLIERLLGLQRIYDRRQVICILEFQQQLYIIKDRFVTLPYTYLIAHLRNTSLDKVTSQQQKGGCNLTIRCLQVL